MNRLIILILLLMAHNSYAGLFCGDDELPCDISKIDTNRNETKIVKNYRFAMADSKITKIPMMREHPQTKDECINDPEIMTPVLQTFIEQSIKAQIQYASKEEYPSQNLKLRGCRIEKHEFVNKKVVKAAFDCNERRVEGYLTMNIICATAEVSTVKGILTPKEIEAERCAKIVMCGSNIKTEKQLKLYADMKKQFCGSGELDNVSTILNIDNSDRAKTPAKSDNQSGSSTQASSAVQK